MIYFIIFFTIVSGEVLNLQTLTIPRALLSSTTNNELLFFAGGLDNTFLYSYDRIDIFNSSSNSWTTASLSVPRSYLTATSLPGLSFFAGGTNVFLGKRFNTVDIFNFSNNQWHTAKLSNERCCCASTSLPNEGLAFFAGGFDGNYSDIIDIYNSKLNNWTTAKLSVPRSFIGGISLPKYGLSFFAGGELKNKESSNVIDIYNSSSGNWTIDKLNIPRKFFATAYLHDYALFAGGCCSIEASKSIEYYNVSSNEILVFNNIFDICFNNLAGTSLPDLGFAFFGGGNDCFGNQINIVYQVFIYQNKIFYFQLYLNQPSNYLTATSLPNSNMVFFAGGINNNEVISTVTIFNICYEGSYRDLLGESKYIFGNNSYYCQVCNPGTYSTIGSFTCKQCPPGYACPNYGTSQPLPGQAGCYIPIPGSQEQCPNECMPGYYCPEASINQKICPPGTFCNISSSIIPNLCPPGTYNPFSGSTSISACTPCPVGSYCNLEIGATSFLPCPAEYFCPAGSTLFMNKCPGKYYCPFATKEIIKCPSGSYCPEGSSVPLPCPSGNYCPPLADKGIVCDGGYQCPFGSKNQTICPVNTFSLVSSGSCSPCPYGEFNLKDGSTSCQECPISNWNMEGWFCMTGIEKIVFVGSWIITAFSSLFSVWKFYSFLKERILRLKKENIKITLYNLIFIPKKYLLEESDYEGSIEKKIEIINNKNIELEKIIYTLKEQYV